MPCRSTVNSIKLCSALNITCIGKFTQIYGMRLHRKLYDQPCIALRPHRACAEACLLLHGMQSSLQACFMLRFPACMLAPCCKRCSFQAVHQAEQSSFCQLTLGLGSVHVFKPCKNGLLHGLVPPHEHCSSCLHNSSTFLRLIMQSWKSDLLP